MKTYAIGDYCLYDGQLYECTAEITTPEAWTAAHWTAATVGTELNDIKGDVTGLKEDLDTVVCVNLMGSKKDILYPVDIAPGEKFTVSTSDGSIFPTDSTLQIQLLDANKTQTDYFSLKNGETYRTITSNSNRARTKYLRWNSVPSVPLMVNYGETVLTYVPYFAPVVSQLDEIKNDISNINHIVINENLIGMEKDVYYHVYPPIKVGEKFTISTANEQTIPNAVDYEWFDVNKTKIAGKRFYANSTTHDTTIVTTSDVHYFKLLMHPMRPMKIERGENVTAFRPYFREYNENAVGETLSYNEWKEKILYPNSFISAYYISLNGLFIESTNYMGTNLIPLNSGDIIHYRLYGSAGEPLIASYDASGAFIEALATVQENGVINEGTITLSYDCYIVAAHRKNVVDDANPYFYINDSQFRKVQLSVVDSSAKANTFVSGFGMLDGWEPHAIVFSKMMEDVVNTEGFLFFTDSHFMAITENGWKPYAYDIMSYIEKMYYSTPCSFILHGGDWLGSGEAREDFLYKLSVISGIFRRNFNRYALLVGNHETGGQSNEHEQFTHDTLAATLLANVGKTYYRFDANTFHMYCFDTWDYAALDAYGKAQIAWFANALLHEDSAHIVVAMHILYDENILMPMGEQISLCAKAYNDRSTYTYDGNTYNFASATGKVAFIIAGHEHGDRMDVVNGIPFILTKNLTGYGGEGNFYKMTPLPLDLIKVDWNNAKLIAYRALRGQAGTTRQMDIIAT